MTNQKLNDFYLVAVDSSLSRPGFAIFHMVDDKIDSVKLSNVNNKTKKKTHGQILDEIKFHFENVIIPYCKGKMKFVREHAAPNHYNETAVYEVIGLLNWQLYKLTIKQKEWQEYYPVTVKKTITGNGKAKKDEVAAALQDYVGTIEYEFDDESDAVAVGLTYLIKNGIIERKVKNNEQVQEQRPKRKRSAV